MVSPSQGRWPQEEPAWLHLDHELVAFLKVTQGRVLKAAHALGIYVTNISLSIKMMYVFLFKCVRVC